MTAIPDAMIPQPTKACDALVSSFFGEAVATVGLVGCLGSQKSWPHEGHAMSLVTVVVPHALHSRLDAAATGSGGGGENGLAFGAKVASLLQPGHRTVSPANQLLPSMMQLQLSHLVRIAMAWRLLLLTAGKSVSPLRTSGRKPSIGVSTQQLNMAACPGHLTSPGTQFARPQQGGPRDRSRHSSYAHQRDWIPATLCRLVDHSGPRTGSARLDQPSTAGGAIDLI